jgi:hypothetical protein
MIGIRGERSLTMTKFLNLIGSRDPARHNRRCRRIPTTRKLEFPR